VVQDPRTTGEVQVAVQRTTGANECTGLSPGVPGAPGNATVPLSGTDFVTCFDLPAGSGSQEIITLDRVEGDGTARLSVYDYDGRLACEEPAAAAYQLLGCDLGGARHMVVVRSATGSGRYRISQVAGVSASCSAPVSTAFGGPATVGAINPGDVRCYRVPANSWIGVRDAGQAPTIRYFGSPESLVTCPELPCLAHASEIIVTSEKPLDYELDTWAVGWDYAATADCDLITDSVAYGFGPITATLSAADRARCVSVPVGIEDDFRLTVENAEPYVVNGDGNIVRCTPDAAAWTCSPRRFNQDSQRALVAFVGKQAGPLRAEATCDIRVRLCGDAHFGIGRPANGPYALTAGTRATFTAGGAALHQQDILWLTRNGEKVTPIVVRSVSANRDLYTLDVDLTNVATGAYDLSTWSYSAPSRPSISTDWMVVQPSQLAVKTKPSISGKAAVGAKVTVNPGVWSPAVEHYEYWWTADGALIPGAIGTSYTIPAALRGKRLAVRVTGYRTGYRENVATSAALTVAYGVAPRATTAPKITGTVKVGKTVKISVGVWSPKATSYRYEWRANGKLIATSASLKLKKSWAGRKLTLVVVAKRTGHYDGRATSTAVKIKK
jgi:hypothetical protein